MLYGFNCVDHGPVKEIMSVFVFDGFQFELANHEKKLFSCFAIIICDQGQQPNNCKKTL